MAYRREPKCVRLEIFASMLSRPMGQQIVVACKYGGREAWGASAAYTYAWAAGRPGAD